MSFKGSYFPTGPCFPQLGRSVTACGDNKSSVTAVAQCTNGVGVTGFHHRLQRQVPGRSQTAQKKEEAENGKIYTFMIVRHCFMIRFNKVFFD
jgi:hypothetical protein